MIREYTFTPKCFEEKGLTGSVTMKMVSNKERFSLMKSLNYKIISEVDKLDPTKQNHRMEMNENQLESMQNFVGIGESLIVSADIKKGEESFNHEDVIFYSEFQDILIEVATIAIEGSKPSKN